MSTENEAYHEALNRIEAAKQSGAESLDLKFLDLTALPPEIGQLSKLTTLDLNSNQLNALPPEIGQLSKLTTLYLNSNQLNALPPEIGQLSKLTQLFLSSNQLNALPPEIGQLSKLTQLFLSSNQLNALPPEIVQLTKLTQLFLSSNQLNALPPEIVQLTKLTRLDLRSNQLNALPPEIVQLTKLTRLDLSSNQLNALPPEIVQLTKLETLLLHENPIDIPAEVLGSEYEFQNKKAQELLAYYTEQQQNAQPVNETKLLVVGQGGVGKTSLIRRLIENTFDPHSPKTEGINIHNHPIEVPERGNIQLNIWDFGGQEIMHATHQFFLTQRSIYLFVLDARIEEKANRPNYWLRLIQNYAPHAPIILVINKIDDNPSFALKESQLKRNYNIVTTLRTSCKTGDGITALQQTLIDTISTLPHVSDKLPTTWFQVKQALETSKQTQDIIPFTHFDTLCDQNEVSDQVRHILLKLLHDLGTVLNFYDERKEVFVLEDTKILNPAWVTEGVYAIINAKEIFESAGVLPINQLKEILDPKRYKTHQARSFILGMMEQFELSYPFDNGKKHLIPDLLPETEPDFYWDESDTLRFEYHYEGYMPPSVFTRFVVRQHERIVDQATMLWRGGVVIGYDGMQALVRVDTPSQKIAIFVQGEGNRRRILLEIIRSEFNYIHATYANLQAQAMVPIPGKGDAVVSYKYLVASEQRGMSEVFVEKLNDFIPIRDLLENVDGSRSRRELRELLSTRLNISELQDAMGDFGLNMEDLAGASPKRPELVRELLDHLERRPGQTEAFLNHITKQRPDIRF